MPRLQPELTFMTLPANPFSLGLTVRFFSNHRPFADFELSKMTTALIHQIDGRQHIAGAIDDHLVAYLGWQRADARVAEDWVAGRGPLLASPRGDVLAVTLLAVADPKFVAPLIREAKKQNPGFSVYWMRYYADGRAPAARVVRVRSVA